MRGGCSAGLMTDMTNYCEAKEIAAAREEFPEGVVPRLHVYRSGLNLERAGQIKAGGSVTQIPILLCLQMT